MKIKILIVSLIIWNLSYLKAQACSPGNSNSLDYIRRDGNRCEGIIKRHEMTGSLELVSLASRGVNTLSNTLTIKIPKTNNSSVPSVIIQTIKTPIYKLDKLNLIPTQESYNFSLPTQVIKNQKDPIDFNKLRAIARTPPNSPVVYTPVIIGQPTDAYEIVFYTSGRVRFRTVKIVGNGKTFPLKLRDTFQKGEILFTWDGRSASAGRYRLDYEADIEQGNIRPERIKRSIAFEHNPKWLR